MAKKRGAAFVPPPVPLQEEHGEITAIAFLDETKLPGSYRIDAFASALLSNRCLSDLRRAVSLAAAFAAWSANRAIRKRTSRADAVEVVEALMQLRARLRRFAQQGNRDEYEEIIANSTVEPDHLKAAREAWSRNRVAQTFDAFSQHPQTAPIPLAPPSMKSIGITASQLVGHIDQYLRGRTFNAPLPSRAEPTGATFIDYMGSIWQQEFGLHPAKSGKAFVTFVDAAWNDCGFPAPRDRSKKPKPTLDFFADRIPKHQWNLKQDFFG